MPNALRLCLAFHNHQPVGNFDHVFEQAYQDSYLPFMEVFDRFPTLPISLHCSGPLMEWLDRHHPEYLDRLAHLVSAGRVEILGGAFYEPILTMVPSHDRIGQIRRFTQWLRDRLDAEVHGMWTPERVWEQSLTSDLVKAGIRYTILDDFHFRCAGLEQEQLYGHFVTESEGCVMSVFPGSERLRYLVPFGPPQETIDYLRNIADRQENAIVVFGDDGEKFGTWPETKRHVYDNGWLHQFFTLLSQNSEWLKVVTLHEAFSDLPPVGKVYIPEGSYREMTEWSLPVPRQRELDRLSHEMHDDPHWHALRGFVRGGFWRNFKIKYPETDEMYSRMMHVSRRLQSAISHGADATLLDSATRELYRGQCNCSYWHGAFGGVYLPHLRHAIFNHLIAAENLLDRALGKLEPWVAAEAEDFNLDGRMEVRLANDRLISLFRPAQGGQLYELDVRAICLNLGSTLARREELYHEKVRAGEGNNSDGVASIHERVVFKQAGLEQRLQYDRTPPKTLVDHFYPSDVSLAQIASGTATDLANFATTEYEARIRRGTDRVQVQMIASQMVTNIAVRITKAVTLAKGGSELEIAYLLEGLPTDRIFHFAVDFHFAGLPSQQEDRFFYSSQPENPLGQLGTRLDLHGQHHLGLVDQWQGIDLSLTFDRPTSIWTYPVETVSQSEGGFELVHQAVAVIPHWNVQADDQGRWSVSMRLVLDTSAAEARMQPQEALTSV